MSNILHVCGHFDPSGDVTRSITELNKYSAHKHEALVHFYHPAKAVMGFPEPEGQNRDILYVREKFNHWADAIIFHLVGWNSQAGYQIKPKQPCAFRNANVEYDTVSGKFYCQLAYFANPADPTYSQLASCHTGANDFMGEDTAFLPALMPIWDTLYTPSNNEREHCVAYLKHSKEILSLLGGSTVNAGVPALDPPQRLPHGYSHRLNLYERAHSDVMRLRREYATISIDNLTEGHYGLAGTESLSQGIPAIAWNHPRTIAQLKDIAPTGGNPFIQASTVKEAVECAMSWPGKTAGEYGRVCRNWIETYYDSRYLIERYWEPFCDSLVKS